MSDIGYVVQVLGASHLTDILRKNSLSDKLERLGKKLKKVMADSHKRIGIKKKIGVDE